MQNIPIIILTRSIRYTFSFANINLFVIYLEFWANQHTHKRARQPNSNDVRIGSHVEYCEHIFYATVYNQSACDRDYSTRQYIWSTKWNEKRSKKKEKERNNNYKSRKLYVTTTSRHFISIRLFWSLFCQCHFLGSVSYVSVEKVFFVVVFVPFCARARLCSHISFRLIRLME